MRMRVRADRVSLRSSPEILDANIIKVLPLSQSVDVIDSTAGSQFWEIKTTVNGEALRGFISQAYLRDEVNPLKEKLIEDAVEEWIYFDRGAGQEDASPYYQRVGLYWQDLGENLDGRNRDVPWSAAFISYIHRRAGFPDFKFSNAHAAYICDSKSARQNNSQSSYWLFPLNEHKPQLGDLICSWREYPQTYATVPTPEKYDPTEHSFPSHTDLVVEIHKSFVRTIGGNVDQSVTRKSFPLTSSGFLNQEGKVFAIMQNNKQ